jgi:hypothetical protein
MALLFSLVVDPAREAAPRLATIEHAVRRARDHADTTGQQPRHQVDGVERDRRASGLRPPTREANRQVQRSFEDTSLKQRALELVSAA